MAERRLARSIGKQTAIGGLTLLGAWYVGVNSYMGIKESDPRSLKGVAFGLGFGATAAAIGYSRHIEDATKKVAEKIPLPDFIEPQPLVIESKPGEGELPAGTYEVVFPNTKPEIELIESQGVSLLGASQEKLTLGLYDVTYRDVPQFGGQEIEFPGEENAFRPQQE